MKLQPVFKVRIVYKSGYTHDFETTKFTLKGNSQAEWDNLSDKNRPLRIGLDDIAAVWQIGVRHRLVWK